MDDRFRYPIRTFDLEDPEVVHLLRHGYRVIDGDSAELARIQAMGEER